LGALALAAGSVAARARGLPHGVPPAHGLPAVGGGDGLPLRHRAGSLRAPSRSPAARRARPLTPATAEPRTSRRARAPADRSGAPPALVHFGGGRGAHGPVRRAPRRRAPRLPPAGRLSRGLPGPRRGGRAERGGAR